MAHRVYRNLTSRDTLFGLDLYDLVILAAITNIIFRIHNPQVWSGKLLNIAILVISYVALVVIKRQFSPGFLKNRISFFYRKHRFRPDPESQLKPMLKRSL